MLNWLVINYVYVTPTAVFQMLRIREILKQNKIDQSYTNIFIFNLVKIFCDEMMQNVLGKPDQTCQRSLYFTEILCPSAEVFC